MSHETKRFCPSGDCGTCKTTCHSLFMLSHVTHIPVLEAQQEIDTLERAPNAISALWNSLNEETKAAVVTVLTTITLMLLRL